MFHFKKCRDLEIGVKVTIAQEETIPKICNGTMFSDLDWPLNTSHGFVSISWASCWSRSHRLNNFPRNLWTTFQFSVPDMHTRAFNSVASSPACFPTFKHPIIYMPVERRTSLPTLISLNFTYTYSYCELVSESPQQQFISYLES